MLKGLYRVHFQTPLGIGAGVVYANNGELWGGDSVIAYRGSFQINGDDLTATVKTSRHTNALQNVFGKENVSITLSGTVNGNTVTCKGTSPEAPGVPLQAVLTKLMD